MKIISAAEFLTETAIAAIYDIERNCFNGDYVTNHDFYSHYKTTYFLLNGPVIVGYYMWYPEYDHAYLYSFAIDKYHQGKGYSKILLTHFLNNSENEQQLHVHPNNLQAIGLYKKFNFVEQEIVDDFYEDGSSAILMRRKNESNVRTYLR